MPSGLLISEILTNPSGDDSPFEYVELIATQYINFAVTPYSVVFANNGNATSNGWIAGSNITYGFSITSGTVNVGDVVYVGGSSMAPTGTKLRTINTATTAGDRFGTAVAAGVLGNGGINADAVAIFDTSINNITNSTVPVDAIFFGSGIGSASVSGGSAGYQLPVNDLYNGGKLQNNSFVASDPGANQVLIATGVYNTATSKFTTPRTWQLSSTATATSAITLTSSTPTVNLSVSSTTGTEAGTTAITVIATASSVVSGNQTVNLAVTGAGITAGDYTLSNTTITIPSGSTTGSVTFTVVDDVLAEGTETATLTISSPSSGITLGSTTSQNVTITDNDVVVNTAPKILADNETVIDPEKVTAFLSIPNNSPTGTPTAFVSGVINDPTDPARTIGIEFNVSDVETAAGSLTVTATSSNTAVVTNANLAIAGTGNSRNLKITPTGVGFADITVTVSDGSLTSSYVIKYAASAAGTSTSRFLTGAANASTAIVIDSNYMLVGDDENQALRLYDRNNSGLPVNSFDFTSSLNLTQLSGGIPREVDIEAAAKVGNRIFWMGSQSNNDSGTNRPNRDRVFGTDISGTGATTTLSYAGRYDFLEEDIIAWDVNNVHGKGANYYGLAASAASGVGSKQSNGYNIEGLEFAPDNTTAYIAFRAPQEPTGTRTKALIVSVSNFTSLLSANGGTIGSATFSAPIELDLGGRGIREIRKNSSNQYVIIAGPAGDATGIDPNDFRLYTWTGIVTDAPVLRSADLTALNVGGSFESIVEVPSSLTSTSQLQLLVDNGTTIFYNDAIAGSDLTIPNFQKSRSETVTLGNPIVRIHDIQGSGSTFNSAFSGSQTIEGIVTRAFQGSTKLNGFYVQEEDADVDGNSATSEAIFVYDSSGLFTGNVGDKVRVTGTVGEFTSTSSGVTSSLTQLSSLTSVVNLGASILPTVTNIQLPVTNVTDLERYEGMLVNVSAGSGDLTVTENFQLGRFGQVVLAATGASNQSGTDARLDQYTQFNAPSVSGYSAYLADIAKREIILDDGSSTQNPGTIIFARGGNPLSATNTLRGGDTVNNITGILDERFEGYRIQTTTGVNFTAANPRPTTPPNVGGTLKVASFNVLNFFNGDGLGGGFPTARGAENLTELNRQRDKIIQAIVTSGVDVVGLEELENDGYGATSAIQDLVNGLNAVAGAGTYAFINPGTSLATDAITVGLIYKPGKVTPIGAAATLTTSAAFNLVGRQPLAQTFQQISTGESFTAVVNHFKSKGSSSGGVGDADAGDGQGFSNGTRTRQAQDLAAWLATKPTGTNDADYLILGDLNAYAKEDPLTTLASAGYNNLLPNTSYSYVFDGQVGSLDHALASASLAVQVTSAEKWHINADEPNVLDYNTNFKSIGQLSSLYNSDPFRASDHDPVIVGLNLGKTITGSGRDPLTGTAGNDQITGGVGAKTITGGGGNDLFIYTSLREVGHRITDFTVGSDKIVLTQLLDNLVPGSYNGSNAITDGYVRLVQGSTANNTVLQIDSDGPLGTAIFRSFIQLDNVTPQAMNSSQNFIF